MICFGVARIVDDAETYTMWLELSLPHKVESLETRLCSDASGRIT